MTARHAPPIASAAGSVWPPIDAAHEAHRAGGEVRSPSPEKPNSFGSCVTTMVSPMPFM